MQQRLRLLVFFSRFFFHLNFIDSRVRRSIKRGCRLLVFGEEESKSDFGYFKTYFRFISLILLHLPFAIWEGISSRERETLLENFHFRFNYSMTIILKLLLFTTFPRTRGGHWIAARTFNRLGLYFEMFLLIF